MNADLEYRIQSGLEGWMTFDETNRELLLVIHDGGVANGSYSVILQVLHDSVLYEEISVDFEIDIPQEDEKPDIEEDVSVADENDHDIEES